jgi:protein-disulfide isomerase
VNRRRFTRALAIPVIGAVAGGGFLARALPTPRPLPVAASGPDAQVLAAMADWGLPDLGASTAPLMLVTFFDYHCSYCRAMDPALPALVAANHDLRLLFADYPILEPDSEVAARLALAAAGQGRYWEAHAWLMRVDGTYTAETALELAAAIGADADRLVQDMNAPSVSILLHRSLASGARLGIEGTPALLSARGVIEGFQSPTTLQDLVDGLRGDENGGRESGGGNGGGVSLQPA